MTQPDKPAVEKELAVRSPGGSAPLPVDTSGLSRWARPAAALTAFLLAVAHMVGWPHLVIDSATLVLLGFVAIAVFVEIDKIEGLGITGRMRRIRQARQETLAVQVEVIGAPTLAPQPSPDARRDARVLHPGPSGGAETRRSRGKGEQLALTGLNVPTDPAERLLWVAEQVRIELVIIAGNAGRLPGSRPWNEYSSAQLAADLAARNLVPAELVTPIQVLVDNRNAMVHGRLAGHRISAAAADLGSDLLIKLRQVKRSYFRVAQSGTAVFSDPNLATKLETMAVMLDALDENGALQIRQVFPTLVEYEIGRFVTWEWDMTRVVQQPVWYRDPKTGAVKEAWSSAASFAGRAYPEEWGIQFRIGGPMTVDG
jgi:hypothetical protein